MARGDDDANLGIRVLQDIRGEVRELRGEVHELHGDLNGLRGEMHDGFAKVTGRLENLRDSRATSGATTSAASARSSGAGSRNGPAAP